MYYSIISLLPILAGIVPALAVPNEQARSLAYPLGPPKHNAQRGLMSRALHSRSRKAKRACRAKGPDPSGDTAGEAASGVASGTTAQVTPAASTAAVAASTAPSDNSTTPAESPEPAPSASAPSASSAAPAPSASTGTSTGGGAALDGKAALTPNGIKAGMTICDGLDAFAGKLGWCYDWTPSPTPPAGMEGASMLWGDGGLGDDQNDAARVAAFKALSTTPKYVIGFEEPDCSTPGSASMTVDASATAWNDMIAPYGAKGSVLISPSMCHQADEVFLTPFKALISTEWDVTNLHINKKDMAGVTKDLDYYWDTYKKPMWITEFACVDDSTGFTPCSDQTEINQFINDIVALFEKDSRVYAYAYSNGIGLGDTWPALIDGQLTVSGKTYLSAVSQYH